MKFLSEIIFNEAKERLKNLTIVEYVLGLSYVCVKTEAGIGVAYTFRDKIPSGCNVMNSDLRGMNALDIAKLYFSDNLLEAAIGLATINSVFDNGEKSVVDITERIDFIDKKVSMIGYFKPVIEKIKDKVSQLYIFELKDIQGCYPSSMAKFYLPESDIVIISGTTLINKTTEDFLVYCSDESVKVLMGSSATLCKGLSVFFHIAGSYINDDSILDAVSKGAGMKGIKPFIEKRWILFEPSV